MHWLHYQNTVSRLNLCEIIHTRDTTTGIMTQQQCEAKAVITCMHNQATTNESSIRNKISDQ